MCVSSPSSSRHSSPKQRRKKRTPFQSRQAPRRIRSAVAVAARQSSPQAATPFCYSGYREYSSPTRRVSARNGHGRASTEVRSGNFASAISVRRSPPEISGELRLHAAFSLPPPAAAPSLTHTHSLSLNRRAEVLTRRTEGCASRISQGTGRRYLLLPHCLVRHPFTPLSTVHQVLVSLISSTGYD